MTDVTPDHLTAWRDAIFTALDRKTTSAHDPGPLPISDAGLIPDSPFLPAPEVVEAAMAAWRQAQPDQRHSVPVVPFYASIVAAVVTDRGLRDAARLLAQDTP